MYGFGGVGLSEVQLSISELSVVGGWVVVGGWTRQMHFMVGPGRGPTNICGLRSLITEQLRSCLISAFKLLGARFSFLKELEVEGYFFTIFSPMRPNILQEHRYEGSVVSRDECRQLIARGRQRRREACGGKR